jgi:hypothetical protein
MNKELKGLAAAVALSGMSAGANASVIECNMESISNPNYEICANLDVDNSRLSFDITSTGADANYDISAMSVVDLDNPSFFLGNSSYNESLSSNGDVFTPSTFSHNLTTSTVLGDFNNLKLTLDINSSALMNSILGGNGIDYGVTFGNLSNSAYTETVYGEAFYTPSNSIDVPEPSTIGMFGLGLLGLAASRRKKKTLESSLN